MNFKHILSIEYSLFQTHTISNKRKAQRSPTWKLLALYSFDLQTISFQFFCTMTIAEREWGNKIWHSIYTSERHGERRSHYRIQSISNLFRLQNNSQPGGWRSRRACVKHFSAENCFPLTASWRGIDTRRWNCIFYWYWILKWFWKTQTGLDVSWFLLN